MAGSVEMHPCILIVDDDLSPSKAVEQVGGRRIRALLEHLKADYGFRIIEAVSFADGLANVLSDASISLMLVDWTLGKNSTGSHQQAIDLLVKTRARNAKVPIFLSADRKTVHAIPLQVMELVDELCWILEDSSRHIAGRIHAAIKRYLDNLLPPLANAMVRYSSVNEYSWAAPGHQGGVAFGKNAAGRVFFDWLGENVFRSDMGIERTALGSLLDHTGPFGAGEKYQSYVFGSTRTYSGVNGSSGSNRVIFSACVQEDQVALVDRNCHKSIEQGLIITGGVPHYMVPTRNAHGVIGPIPPATMEPDAVAAGIAQNPLVQQMLLRQQRLQELEGHGDPSHVGHKTGAKPVYAVVTNSTYDGLLIDAERAERHLGGSVDRVHFDEAWYAYARFNPIYKGRFAMRGDPKDHPRDAPTVYATQSTHKLLAALSQATFIHVREGRASIPHHIFNEAYCMHTTTSPLYAISASNDISAAMMDHGSGKSLTDECIREAVAFRQSLMRAYREITKDTSALPLPHVGSNNSLPSLAPASTAAATAAAGGAGGNGGGGAGADDASGGRATRSHGLPPASAAAAAAAAGGSKKGGSKKDSGLTQGSWFFHPWNAFEVTDPATGNKVPFDHAKPDLLATDPRCWVLNPEDKWHGFTGLAPGWCMLDPIKVAIVSPGMAPDGTLLPNGIPAAVVAAYLSERGIIPARVMDHMILFLFSIGITKGKWGTLLSALLAFRADYERNEPISRVLPSLYEDHRDSYRGKGLRDLCDEMFAFKAQAKQADVLYAAFDALPHPAMTPRAAFQRLMAGDVDDMKLDELEGRVSAVSIIPYPPGIPMVMSGEVLGPTHVAYLRAMEALDKAFPGFESEIQGVETGGEEGYVVTCLKDHSKAAVGMAVEGEGEGEAEGAHAHKKRKA